MIRPIVLADAAAVRGCIMDSAWAENFPDYGLQAFAQFFLRREHVAILDENGQVNAVVSLGLSAYAHPDETMHSEARLVVPPIVRRSYGATPADRFTLMRTLLRNACMRARVRGADRINLHLRRGPLATHLRNRGLLGTEDNTHDTTDFVEPIAAAEGKL